MVNYENGKIYKIVCRETGKQYIGSTCIRLLCNRLSSHVFRAKNTDKRPALKSKEIIDNNNYYIELIEECPCKSKDELLKRERFFIENNECVNKQIPSRSKKEYQEVYKKTKITCECGCIVNRNSLAEHRRTKKHLRNYTEVKK